MQSIFKNIRAWALANIVLLSSLILNAAEPSGTLPTLYINTDGGVAITSKEDYVSAGYYLDPNGNNDIEAFGSANAPLPLQIKGRGNYTWTGFDKKPYRLKLTAKAALLGMAASKHFGLLAHADDSYGFMRNTVGFELSRRLGLAWTPNAQPVEVVLNNDYIGLYFLTELIRVDQDRVNIVEQADEATDPEVITGGWLVEIDNYDTDPHVEITEGNGERIIFTYKTPEVLSAEQENYLRSQMTAIDKAIYASDKTSTEWEKYIDIDALARFYIVHELMDNCESFHGSCYMHRDLGIDKKWIFGPVWDFGNSMNRGTSKFIWDEPTFNQTWISEIYKFPRFETRVKEIWKEFCNNNYSSINQYIITYAESISEAAKHNAQRWPQYGNANVMDGAMSFASKLQEKAKWLSQQWGNELPTDWSNYTIYFRGDQNNWDTSQPMKYLGDALFTLENIDITGRFKLATDDWRTIDLGGTEGTPAELNKTYQLVDVGANISIKDNKKLYNVKLSLNLKDKTLIISDKQGVGDINNELTHNWQLSGCRIYAPNPIAVYTTTGVLVVSACGEITLPTAGLYIIVENNIASKVLIK